MPPTSAREPSRFRSNLVRLVRANTVALIVPIASTPILTRLFSPDDYGLLAGFVSVLALVTAFSTWRFDWTLPNARSRGMATAILIAGGGTLGIVSIAVAGTTTALMVAGMVEFWWLLLPLAAIGSGLQALLAAWFVRDGDLAPVGRSTIARSLSNSALGLAAGGFGAGPIGLVGATTASSWMGVGTMVRCSGDRLAAPLRRTTWRRIRLAIRRHSRNASWSTLVSVVNAASLNLPVLMFVALFTPAEAGWYSLMLRLVFAPANVFGNALGQSFWSMAAEHSRSGRLDLLARAYRRTTWRLALASTPVLLICLAGPLIIGPLLGEREWGGAGWVLLAMAPMFFGAIVFSPTNHLVVLERQHLQLIADGGRLGLSAIAVWISYRLDLGFTVAVAAASTASLLGHTSVFLTHLAIHRRHG